MKNCFAFNKVMKNFLTWRFGVVISCGVTMGVVLIFLNHIKKPKKNKKNPDKKNNKTFPTQPKRIVTSNQILELPYPRWKKVGKVKELYFYPLKSGRGKELSECLFTECGIAVNNKGVLTLKDRMFLIYNEETGKFITSRVYPTLILVSLSAVNESKVKLEAVGMSTLIFDIPEQSATKNYVTCSMWWNEKVKCIDCGDESAKWISEFLTGTNSGLRVGLSSLDQRNILKGPWEKFTKVYDKITNDDVGLFSDLSSYMLLTESSLEELNRKLENPVSSLQLRPNIVVSGSESFAEDNWEWIKIGESAVIRNIKPCPRCSMIRVDPDTGKIDKEEPTKTLKTFREQIDKEKIKVDGTAPIMGIYCGLYVSGHVKVNDDVFVHVPQTIRTTQL
ncbi:mitochondrial amidoxime-reducing component 1-like [Chelonus insularis]|uniref:mitochondrial amidoxime-reducing component 1-like n=1 Tax=Chelonus insularis TaxID=460826 RepID=UPI00158A4322|nr:mitochondrial amidoxime-reducing component 1-like [Chelonus insularis]